MRFGADYDLMLKAQKTLMIMMDKPMKPAEASKLTQALVLVVSYKRELRGLPRLRASDMIAGLKRLNNSAPRPDSASQPIEITTEPQLTKESLKHALEPTVTAPPTPEAPIDEGV